MANQAIRKVASVGLTDARDDVPLWLKRFGETQGIEGGEKSRIVNEQTAFSVRQCSNSTLF